VRERERERERERAVLGATPYRYIKRTLSVRERELY
jgi:hypothetical protein